jgi:hypothetical protein
MLRAIVAEVRAPAERQKNVWTASITR